jgi:cob(I)alamin adenosyltransferase
MRTFNKKGDTGETSLLYGARVPKSDPHCEAYGAVDEAVAAVGLARALADEKRVQDMLMGIQKDLIVLSGEMATPSEAYTAFAAKHPVTTSQMVQKLEDLIDELEKEVDMPKEFITPGATAVSAAINIARATVRRAEREAVKLHQGSQLANEQILKYLNRLADLLFTLVCYEEAKGVG